MGGIDGEIKRVGIVGTGMIGGSFALALKGAGRVRELVGYDANVPAAREAVSLGVVDRQADSIAELVLGSDCVLVAVPVASVAECVRQCLGAGAKLVMEAGSVKQPVFDALGDLANERFVSVHPIAGTDRSGPSAARADMYQGNVVVVISQGDAGLRSRACELWSACGARCVAMDVAAHDASLALTSHLPHLLAFALMGQVAQSDPGTLKSVIGPGFRDFTRLARGNDVMWGSIFDANRDALDREVTRFQAALEVMRSHLGHSQAMRTALREATETFAMLR